jgi:uncharacterized protein
MSEEIHINFARPLPVFPLPDAVLLPRAILPLHIFEPRYRQMVDDCLDHAGVMAMATYASGDAHGATHSVCDFSADHLELRPVTCVGHILQHEALPGGRHNIILHGLCRAKIVELHEPDEARLYLTAKLLPLDAMVEQKPAQMTEVRDTLRALLRSDRLSRMRNVDTVLEWFSREDIPTDALLELIGFTMVKDNEVRYQLLAEPDPQRRAEMIVRDLKHLDALIRRADRQSHKSWPKGMSWN